MPTRSIDLVKTHSKWVENQQVGVRIRITATANVNIPKEVFVFNAAATSATQITATFSNVASPNDLVAVASGMPTTSDVTKFRIDYVDMFCPSLAVANELYRVIKEDVAQLIRTLETMDTFTTTSTETLT